MNDLGQPPPGPGIPVESTEEIRKQAVSVLTRLRTQRVGRAGPGLKTISYVAIGVACLIALGPFIYIVTTSIKDSVSLFDYSARLIPDEFYLGNFAHLLSETPFLRWVLNTLFVTAAVTVVKVVIDSMAGYAFAKMEFPGKRLLFLLTLVSIMIPFSAILIPLYFLVRGFGLLDSYWALILPPLGNPIGIFLMRSFIQGLPGDLVSAARVDGTSEFRIYTTIVLPLVKPGLVVLAVLTALTQYTSFIWPLVATSSDEMKVITTGLATQRGISVVDYGLLSAGSLMAMVPITIFFIVLMRYFIAGSLAGALKQ